MRADFDPSRDVWGPLLAASLRMWSDTVLRPAQILRSAGLYRPPSLGTRPNLTRFHGGGRALVERCPSLTLLRERPAGYDRLRQFDAAAAEYQTAVQPFSGPLFEETLTYLDNCIVGDARLLDAAAGPGREALLLSHLVPDGEVVAADLSENMIRQAHANVRDARVNNIVCFQADVADPPEVLVGHFDAVFCQLAFHYFPDGPAVAHAFRRLLAPHGRVFVTDPGPGWFNAMATPLAMHANPAYVRYRTGEEFRQLFEAAGFASTYWTELLPGIGLLIASTSG